MACNVCSSTPTPCDDDDVTVVHSNCSKDKLVGPPPGYGGPPSGQPPNEIWNKGANPTTPPQPATCTGGDLGNKNNERNLAMSSFSRVQCMKPWQLAWSIISDKEKRNEFTSDACFDSSGIRIGVEYAIADAGATGHFLVPEAPVINKAETTNPLSIHLPDGEKISSTHICELNAPSLPKGARKVHIVPGLAHCYLVSIRVLCEEG